MKRMVQTVAVQRIRELLEKDEEHLDPSYVKAMRLGLEQLHENFTLMRHLRSEIKERLDQNAVTGRYDLVQPQEGAPHD